MAGFSGSPSGRPSSRSHAALHSLHLSHPVFLETGVRLHRVGVAGHLGHQVRRGAAILRVRAANVGGGQLRDSSDPNFSSKDFQIYPNQFIGKEGAVSALYYHGTVSIPVPGAATPTSWTNSFDRVAVFAAVPVIRKLFVEGGLLFGWDNKFDAASNAASADRFLSTGWFGQLYYHHDDYVGAIVRFDYFDPSRSSQNDQMEAVTAGINGALLNGAQAILEYQLVTAKIGESLRATSHNVQLQLSYLF